MEACNRISSWAGDIHYTHTPGWSADQLCREAEVYAHNGQCDILIIDYLSKCSPSSRQMKTYGVENTPRQTDDIETIKNFAERLQVRVVTADQLNKDGRETSFDKLRSEDVEGSGQKTARVNVVALLWRDKSAEEPEKYRVGVKIDKNTLGVENSFWQQLRPERYSVFDVHKEPLA